MGGKGQISGGAQELHMLSQPSGWLKGRAVPPVQGRDTHRAGDTSSHPAWGKAAG